MSSSGQLRNGTLDVLERNEKIDPSNALPSKLFCPFIYLSFSPSVFSRFYFLPKGYSMRRAQKTMLL